MSKKYLLIFSAVLVVFTIGGFLFLNQATEIPKAWEGSKHKDNSIAVLSVSEEMTRPLLISTPHLFLGQVRNDWLYNGGFPVEIRDASDTILWSGYAHVTTQYGISEEEGYSAFEVETQYPYKEEILGQKGKVVFKKSNPSGLPKNNDEFIIEGIFGEEG